MRVLGCSGGLTGTEPAIAPYMPAATKHYTHSAATHTRQCASFAYTRSEVRARVRY